MALLFSGSLLADYHQVYLADEVAGDTDPTAWTEEDVRTRLHVEPGMVILSTARNMEVPVELHLHEAEPALDPIAADHVAEAGLVTSGRVVVAGCTDYRPTAARIAVPAGTLRLRAEFTGLGTLSEDGLDGEDRYVVHLWPGEASGVVVRRQWEEPDAIPSGAG